MNAWWARTWPPLLAVAVVALVGAPAAIASYLHARDVAARHDPTMAPWLPLSVDGMLLAALVVMWVRRHRRDRIGVGPWAAFLFGMVVTVAANLAAVDTPGGEAYIVALFPPLALGIALELVALVAYRTAPTPDPDPLTAEGSDPFALEEWEDPWEKWGIPTQPELTPMPVVGLTTLTPVPDPVGGPPDPDPLTPASEEGSDPPDSELLTQLRAWSGEEGSVPSRERIRVRFGIGSKRADRLRTAVLTPDPDPLTEEATP